MTDNVSCSFLEIPYSATICLVRCTVGSMVVASLKSLTVLQSDILDFHANNVL